MRGFIADDGQAHALGVGAHRGPIFGVDGGGDDHFLALPTAHGQGHDDRLGHGCSAIVVGGVGHLHARQGTDHALVLKDGLQGALAHLGLVGRVGGVELGAARYMLHHAGHEMVVGPCAQEASVVVEVGVLLAHGLQFGQNLHL